MLIVDIRVDIRRKDGFIKWAHEKGIAEKIVSGARAGGGIECVTGPLLYSCLSFFTSSV